MIRGSTRIVAILGDPVAHSRSPAMHNAAFGALGLDFAYVALRVDPRHLRKAVTGVRVLGLVGLNVTVPHKERIVALLDDVSEAARAIGAVNTVVRDGERLVGDNTDAEGFRRALRESGARVRRKAALLLGAGGSARAVVWALAKEGVGILAIANRTAGRARKLATLARELGIEDVRVLPFDTSALAEAAATARLVVNSTSLGLDGRSRPPIDPRRTPENCSFHDLVYGSTPFLRAAEQANRPATDGRRMLVHQAALAFERWTGKKAPLDVIDRASR